MPVDLGGSLATSINIGAYENLKTHLGLTTPSRVLSLRSMIAEVENEILDRYHIDTRGLPLLGNSRPTERLPDGTNIYRWMDPAGYLLRISGAIEPELLRGLADAIR